MESVSINCILKMDQVKLSFCGWKRFVNTHISTNILSSSHSSCANETDTQTSPNTMLLFGVSKAVHGYIFSKTLNFLLK